MRWSITGDRSGKLASDGSAWKTSSVLGIHRLYDESYVIWPKVAAISSAENSNSPFTDAKRPYGSARHLPNVNFSNIFASFAQSPCMPCFAPSD